ncbi:MAG TPA: response regulator [Ktedonobacteraceae bacterium]|jgi:DNA-binding response OmpR family regulator|nr:response regulator [Ktedonobacteraceae bacterium]
MRNEQKTIFVLDDDLDILEFLQALLQQEGYRVVITSKAESLEKLISGDTLPDLILMDVFLSGSDGCEIVKQLKSQEKSRSIPVVMFSAHPGVEGTARHAGADAFVSKPFEMDELLAKIEHYL